jgi:hypothetical protein
VYTHIVYIKKLFVTIVFGHYKFKITVVLNIPFSAVKEKTPSYFSAIAEMLLVPNPWSSLFEIGYSPSNIILPSKLLEI